MGYWKIVRPKANTNYITDPTFYSTPSSSWGTDGTNVLTQSSVQSAFGPYSMKAEQQVGTNLAYFSKTFSGSGLEVGGSYTFSIYAYVPSGLTATALTIGFSGYSGSTVTDGTADMTKTNQWQRIIAYATIVGGDLSGTLFIKFTNSVAGDYIYVDGAMLCHGTREETLISGELPGCYWASTPHGTNSDTDKSIRSQFDRRGGEILDLESDLYFRVEYAEGVGMVESKNNIQPISNQGGASYGGNQTQPRSFSLSGVFNGSTDSTTATFHSRKRTLLKILNPKTNTDVDNTPLPVLIHYTGSDTVKEISAYYDGGFSGSYNQPVFEGNVTLRFIAPDPFFYDRYQPAKILTTTDSATFRLVARRIGSPQNITGDVWDSMGPPHASGTYTTAYAMAEDDTYIYVGGNFVNFDNIANADYIVRWHKANRAWSALGTGADEYILHMVVSGSYLYVVGRFTTIGGVTCRGVARWDGSNWAALGPPSSGGGGGTPVQAVAIDPSGNVYVGGNFTNWDGIANADYIAKWNGSAWSALGTGMDGAVFNIVWHDDYLYAVGTFATAGGTAADAIARWNGSTWSAISTDDITGTILKIVFDSGGNFYIGGSFTAINGDTNLKRVAYWNGQTYISLDGGASSGQAWELVLDSDANLIAAGTFTSMGTLSTLGDSVAKWNGSTWSHADINFAASAAGQSLLIAKNGDLYIGTDSVGVGTGIYAGTATLSYSGSAENYPTITIKRTGGTTARLMSIRNETTDAELTFDYAMSNGETITIELNPFIGVRLISSFIGNVPGAILPGNDIGAFYLDPGNGSGSKDNIITCYVSTSGSPTILGLLQYRNAYLSQD